MPLLPRVLLRDLQFDALVRLLQSAKKWRHRFAGLKINGTILDLDDDVVVEFSVQRMEDVISGPGAIVLQISPIQMMVINKCAIEKHASMWPQRARNHIGRVSRRSPVG